MTPTRHGNTPGGIRSLPKISDERIARTLDRMEVNYAWDEDGDVGGYWDGHLFFFLIYGTSSDALKVQARWSRVIPQQKRPELLEAVNEWAGRAPWPTSWLSDSREDGTLELFAQVATDLHVGVTDGQLEWLIKCALVSTLNFFDFLDEQVPGLTPIPIPST